MNGASRGAYPDTMKRSISPAMQEGFERTQQAIENARARSREMIRRDPYPSNGYERHGGSP